MSGTCGSKEKGMNDTESPSKSSKAMQLRKDEKSDERKVNGIEEDEENRER